MSRPASRMSLSRCLSDRLTIGSLPTEFLYHDPSMPPARQHRLANQVVPQGHPACGEDRKASWTARTQPGNQCRSPAAPRHARRIQRPRPTVLGVAEPRTESRLDWRARRPVETESLLPSLAHGIRQGQSSLGPGRQFRKPGYCLAVWALRRDDRPTGRPFRRPSMSPSSPNRLASVRLQAFISTGCLWSWSGSWHATSR